MHVVHSCVAILGQKEDRRTHKQLPTFCEWNHNQGPVDEDRVRQVLGHPDRLSLAELYKTDT